MPIIRVPSGAATKPPAKPAPPPKAPPRITAPVRGPKTVANYAPPGKSDTAAPTAARGRPIPVPSYHAPAPRPKAPGRTAFTRTGNSLPLAAVVSPKLPSAVGRFLAHAAEDVPAAVKGTVIGAEALGKAGVQSVEQGNLTPLGHVLHGMWHNSIPQLLLEGAFQHPFDAKGMQIADQIKHDFYAHPVLSAMQVTPMGKLADLGRSAAADEATLLAPRAAATGSDITTLHPTSTAVRSLPRVGVANLKAAVTGNADHATTLAQKAVQVRLHDMVDNLKGTETRSIRHALEEHSNRLRKVIGKADPIVKHNLTRAVVGQLRNRDTARTDLNALSDSLRSARAEVEKNGVPGGGVSKKAALKAIDAQHHSLEKLLDSPRFNAHINTIFEMKPQIVAHIEEIDAEMRRLGLLAESQAERRAVEPYALTHIPGARMATAADKIPQHEEALAANKAVKAADANFASSREHYRAVNGLRGRGSKLETDTIVADARRQLANAKKAEASRLKFIQGRVGVKTPLKPGQYAKLDKAMRLTTQRQEELAQALARNKEERSFLQQRARNGLAAATQTKEDAHSTAAYLKPFQGQHYTGLVIDDGTGVRRLPTEEIRAHMRANGVDPTAYVSGKLPTEAQSLMSRWRGSRGDAPGHAYTGTSLRGLWDSSAEGLHNSMMQSVRRIEQAKSHDRIVRNLAVARDLTPQQASDLAQHYEAETGIKLSAINQHAARLSEEQAQKVHGLQGSLEVNPEEALSNPDHRVALVPQTVMDRLDAHAKADESGQMIQTVNRAFRNAVLPFSPKWITGNAVEAAVRSALAGARPGDARLFKQVMDAIPKDQRDEFLAQSGASAGTHFGFGDERNFVASLRPGVEKNPNVANALRRSGKRAHAFYTGVRNGIYHMNRKMESGFEHAVAGHAFRQWSKQWEDVTRKQENYFEALGRHVATPQMAEETAHEIHAVLGKYNDFSPNLKRVINTVAPFGPWYLNAVKFVTYTLPVQHPLVNAALTATGAHEQNYVNNAQPYAERILGGRYGDLTTAIKSGDKYTSVDRFLPEGAFSGGPTVDTALNAVVPQYAGIYNAAQGRNPYGGDLYSAAGGKLTPGEASIAAINQLFTEFIPGSNMIEKLQLGGNTAAGNSTIWNPVAKPSTDAGFNLGRTLGKMFDPFWPTDLGVRAPSQSTATMLPQSNIPGGTLKVPGGKSNIPGGTLKVPSGR